MYIAALNACCRDHFKECPAVSDKYRGIVLKGLEIGNNAEIVTIAISSIFHSFDYEFFLLLRVDIIIFISE
jgi:hypothetical protein